MKPKIAFFADLHARGKDLEAFRAQWTAGLAAASRRGCRIVAIAGDIYDRANVFDSAACTGAIQEAVAVPLANWLAEDPAREVVVVIGNHDYSGAGSKHALQAIELLPRVHFFSRPGFVVTGGVRFLCVPWDWDSGATADEVTEHYLEEHAALIAKERAAGGKLVLLAHAQVIGARLQGIVTCEENALSFQYTRDFLDVAPFDRIALGDFHGRQELVVARGGYIGALRQLGFGEAGNPTGFEVWDAETGFAEFVALDSAPKHFIHRPAVASERITLLGNGWIEKVVYPEGALVSAEVADKLAAQGVVVEVPVIREERTARAEVPPGILTDHAGLIRFFAENKVDPWNFERLDRAQRLYAELIGAAAATSTLPEVESA